MNKPNWTPIAELYQSAKESAFVSVFPQHADASCFAIQHNDKKFNYAQLSDAGLRLATLILRYISAKAGSFNPVLYNDSYRIALYLPRGAGALALLNAGLACGALCVFIDVEQQRDKTIDILTDFDPDLVVGSDDIRNVELDGASRNKEHINFNSDEEIFTLASSLPPAEKLPNYRKERPALVIYTSGSTGKPKGVVLSHLNVSAHKGSYDYSHGAQAFQNQICLGSWQSSSLIDVICSLRARGLTHLLDKKIVNFPIQLAKYLIAQKVVTISGPSSFVKLIFDCGLITTASVPHLMYVELWGESSDPLFIRSLIETFPGLKVRLSYESSEALATSLVSFEYPIEDSNSECIYQVNPNIDFEYEPNQIDLSHNYYRLRVTGSNVMMGYWHELVNTALPTANSPYDSYLFEDWIEPVSHNLFRVQGRIDNMVKVLGNKVSLSSIEAELGRIPDIQQSCVFVQRDDRDVVRIVAVVCTNNSQINKATILSHCKKTLSKEAVPTYIELLSEFPRVQSGKIDRKLLEKQVLDTLNSN